MRPIFPIWTIDSDGVYNIGQGTTGRIYLRPSGRIGINYALEDTSNAGVVQNTLGGNTRIIGTAYIEANAFILGNAAISGNFTLNSLGRNISIREGGNASMGRVTLVAGSVTIAAAKITANSRIFIQLETPGGGLGFISYTKNIGVGFTINSTSPSDTSIVNYLIIEAN